MERCRICGREFDPLGFQVVVPGLGQSFDRVVCARKARATLPPAAAVTPVEAVVRPFPERVPLAAGVAAAAAGVATAAAAARRPLLVGANAGVLAGGAAATAYLWLRVLGADPAPPALPGTSAAPAVERNTVPALVETASGESAETGKPVRNEPRRVSQASRASRSATAPRAARSQAPTLVATNPPATGDGGGGGGSGRGGGGGTTIRPEPAAPTTPAGPSGGPPGHAKSKAKHEKPHANAHTKGKGKKVGHKKHH